MPFGARPACRRFFDVFDATRSEYFGTYINGFGCDRDYAFDDGVDEYLPGGRRRYRIFVMPRQFADNGGENALTRIGFGLDDLCKKLKPISRKTPDVFDKLETIPLIGDPVRSLRVRNPWEIIEFATVGSGKVGPVPVSGGLSVGVATDRRDTEYVIYIKPGAGLGKGNSASVNLALNDEPPGGFSFDISNAAFVSVNVDIDELDIQRSDIAIGASVGSSFSGLASFTFSKNCGLNRLN